MRVGSRGSKLALKQCEYVLERLREVSKEDFIIKVIKTKGDEDARPLYDIGSKGIFEKEIDLALLNNEIDLAVHSMKDLPSELPNGLTIAAVPKREEPNDVLISKGLLLNELKSGSIIGTSSLRRMAEIRYLRKDLNIKAIRGNVETRINKMLNGDYDAIILAEAGLKRLGIDNYITQRFDIKEFVPAPCQGSLAVVARDDDKRLITILRSIEDANSRLESIAERSLLAEMNAGCKFPLGAVARVIGNKIMLYSSISSLDASKRIYAEMYDDKYNADILGKKVAKELISKGAIEIAKEWRYE
ncbi:MAG: hydroxymethylbilane synthase [Candidatus Nitrosocaldaceae archaeon]